MLSALPREPISPDVYFPIEISSREYAGHIMLAVRLSSSRINSVVGHREPVGDLIRSASHPGVIYFKGPRVEEINRPDFLFVGQDPEAGIVHRDYADFFAYRLDVLGRLESSSAYFCFGEFDFAYLSKKFPNAQKKIHQTGSPRAMLWGSAGEKYYQSRVQKIRERYRDFILLVSSGASGNRYLVSQNRLLSRRQRLTQPVRNVLRHDAHKRDRLLALGLDLGRATGLNVVFRPHPAEDWAFWQNATAAHTNAFVDSAFDLNAWLRAAMFAVQTSGSTTAFEGWCSNTPVVSDSPANDYLSVFGERSKLVTGDISLTYSSGEQLLANVHQLSEQWESLRRSESAQGIVAHRLYAPSKDATTLIASSISDLVDLHAPTGVRLPPLGGVWRRRVESFVGGIQKEEVLGRAWPPPFKRWPLSRDTVEADVAEASAILSVPTPNVVQLLPNAFLIEPS